MLKYNTFMKKLCCFLYSNIKIHIFTLFHSDMSGFVSVENHSHWQKLFRFERRLRETPGTIVRSAYQHLVRLPEPWNYYLSFDIYFINLSKLLRAQEFQGSGVATPLEWLLEKLKAFSQLLVILGSYFLENWVLLSILVGTNGVWMSSSVRKGPRISHLLDP